MKLNIYQKLILLLYSSLFIYFTILHVPFKTSYRGEIRYDSLFSNSGNLDVSRFISIMVVISILAALLLWLFHNIDIPKSQVTSKSRKRVIALGSFCVIVAVAAIVVITKRQTVLNQDTEKYAADS